MFERTIRILLSTQAVVLLVLFQCVQQNSVYASQMSGSDVVMNYSNAKYMTQMTLKFEIVNAIIQTDYIKFMLPFPLHRALMIDANAPTGYQRPYGLIAKWSSFDPITNVESTQKMVQLFCQTGESSTYYSQFLQNVQQVSPLSPGWYKIVFNIIDPLAVNSQKEVQLLQIQTSTVSSIDPDAVVYDSNQAHSFLYLDKQPLDSLGLNVSFQDDTQKLKLSLPQNVFFDLTIDSSIIDSNENKRFIISISDKSFQLQGSCASAGKSSLPIINNLASSDYTCTVDQNANQIVLILNISALQKQTTYRIAAVVQNPSFVKQGVDVNIKAMREQSATIIQTGIYANAFSTDSLSIDYHELNLAWGIYDLPSLPMNIFIVRGSPPADPGYTPYNQINLRFKLKDNTPPLVEQRIIITLNTEITSLLLTGSIMHNLPSAPNKDVTCRELDAADPLNRRLVCSQVGALTNTNVYYLSFKMFFDYEVYEAPISCETFGTIQIQSMVPVTSADNIFAISLDLNFINQMRDNNQASVVNIDSNNGFLEKLKSFDDIVILVNAQDFTDYPDEVYATSRPYNFANKFNSFQDFFVPANSVQFINYLQASYPNIYIAQFPQTDANTVYDIIKAPNPYYTIQQTVPRNMKQLLTKNGLNWKQPSSDIIASTYKTGQANTFNGFKFNQDSNYDYELKISLNGQFSDVTNNAYVAAGNPVLPNNVGVLFMMNPLIKFNTPTVVSATAKKLSNLVTPFTGLQVEFKNQNDLSSYFPSVSANKDLIIQQVNLQTFTNGMNCVQTNLDIYVQTIDGIAGAQNTQARIAYVLINGYSINNSALNGITAGIVNYWSTATDGNNGQYVPSLLRVTGMLTNPQQKISIFFDNFEPLYFNQSQDLLSCASTLDNLSQPECKVYKSANPNVLSFFQMSRIDVTVNTPSNTLLFQVIIPIRIPLGVTQINLYLGTINSNSAFIHVKPIAQLSYVLQGATLSANVAGGTSNPTYGITCEQTCKAGDIIPSLPISATHTGGSISQNTPTNIGAGFTFVTNYAFYQSTSVISSIPAQFGTGKQSCVLFSYRYYGSSRYGLFCPLEGSIPTTATSISNFQLPQLSLISAYGAYSTNTGLLITLLQNTKSTIASAIIATPAVLPIISIDAKQKASAISFTFLTPTDLPSSFAIKLENASNFQIASRETYQVCKSTIANTATICQIQDSASLVNLQFQISVKGGQVLRNSSINIILYGLTTASTGADITTATLKIVDPTATQIYSIITGLKVAFNNEAAPVPPNHGVYATNFDVSSLTQTNLNMKSKTSIYFDLLVSSKYLFENERIQISFDSFSSVNAGNLNDLKCLVLNTDPFPDLTKPPATTPKPLSNDIKTMKFQIISKVLVLNIIFKAIGYQKERIYSVQCYNFNVPLVPSTAIDFKFFALQTLVPLGENQIFPVLPATLQKSTPALKSVLQTSANTSQVTKQYGSPGSASELIFQIQTVQAALDQNARVLIYFPSYYPPLLSRDGDNISCLQNDSLVITCTVKNLRVLEIKYFKQNVQKGQILNFTVSGVIQPLNYSVGQFLVILDNDYNNDSFIESIQLQDNPVRQDQSFLQGSLLVLQASISSIYLLQDGVNYTFTIKLDSEMNSISYGQYIIVNFPQIFAKQLQSYTNPDCSITQHNSPQKEYSGSCQAFGLRIKIQVNELMTSGQSYDISIQNIYNPPIYGPQAYKWIIEIGDINQEFILYRSFASTSNYADQQFIQSPDQQLLNFMDVDGTTIQSLSLIQGVISDPVYIERETITDFVFARSFTLESITDEITTLPLKPSIIVGSQSNLVQFKSDTAIGQYEVQLEKKGDGNFYANLPTLTMIFDNNNQQIVAFREQPLKIDLSTINIFLTLSTLLPIDNISIQFSVPNTNVFQGLVLDPTKSTLQFTSTQRSGILPFTLNSIPAVSTKVQLAMAITGPNASSYTLPLLPVEIEFVAQDATVLAVSVTPVASTTNPSKAVITAGCGKSAMFYWGISLKYDSDITKCALTQDLLLSQVQDNSNDVQLCFYQYGQVYIYSGLTSDIKIRDLRINSNYRIYGLCIDGNNSKSFTTIPIAMQTVDNTGKSMKMQIDFGTAPTKEQKQKVICFLTLFFAVQPKNAKTFDGTYCQEMFEMNRRRMLAGVASNQLNCAEEVSDIPIIQQQGMYTEIFYFAKNMDVDNDQMSTKLLSATKKKCFKTYFATNVIGIPQIVNIYTAKEISLVAPTQAFAPQVYTGTNWAYFDIKLQQNGLVFFILDLSTNSPPSGPQIIKGSNYNNQPALSSATVSFDSKTSKSANYTFYPLTAGQTYTIYYVLGNECPFPDQVVFTSVQNVAIKADAVPSDSASQIITSYIIILLLLQYFI